MTPQGGEVSSMMITDFAALNRISAYIVENKQQLALEADVKNMVVEANEISPPVGPGKDFDPRPPNEGQDEGQDQRLDAIYDDEPLGFEKDPLATNIKMLALKIPLKKWACERV